MQRIKKNDVEIKSRKICSVPQCSTYGNSIISLHKFPSNPKTAKKWKMILKIGKPISKFMFVCSKHFVIDDFFSVTSATKRKRLKYGSVPSQNLPVLKYQHSIIRKNRSDRSWLKQRSNGNEMQLEQHENKQVGVHLSREHETVTLHSNDNEHDYVMDPGKSSTAHKKSYHTAPTHAFSEATNTDFSNSHSQTHVSSSLMVIS